jgi:hypothetical protein
MNEELVSVEDVNLGVLVRKIDSKYTVNTCDADYAGCPVCESSDITYGEPDPDSIFIYRIHTCNNCGTTWEERYDLAIVTINPGRLKKDK